MRQRFPVIPPMLAVTRAAELGANVVAWRLLDIRRLLMTGPSCHRKPVRVVGTAGYGTWHREAKGGAA